MIAKLLFRYTSIQTLFQNKVASSEMKDIQQFCSFFEKALEDLKTNKNMNLQHYVNQLKEYNIEQNNYSTLDWLYKNVQQHTVINDSFNNLLATQFALVSKGIDNDMIDQEFTSKYSQAFQNYHMMMEPNKYYTSQILHYMHTIQRKFGTLSDEESKALIVVCDESKLHISKLWPHYLATQLFYISQLNLSTQNLKVFFETFILYTFRISEVMEQFNDLQLKSLYYSIGKHGFYTNKMKQFLFDKLMNNDPINDEAAFILQINLLLCTSNLFLTNENRELFTKKITSILSVKDQFFEKFKNNFVILFSQIFRCSIFEEQIWDFFFSIREEMPQTAPLLYLYLNMIKNPKGLTESQQRKIQQQLAPNEKTYVESIQQQRRNFAHPMEQYISVQIDALGIDYEYNKMIDCYEVDFYFPKYNLIVELCGPVHYSFNIEGKEGLPFLIEGHKNELILEHKYNLVTQQKKKYLENLNYRVLDINFYDFRENNVQTIILNFIKQLK